jgi:DNA-binding beta-propeller fold protein YncE
LRSRCTAPLVAVLLATAASAPAPAAAAPPPAPTYAQTIGGPAHAEMYPSGVDAHSGVVYIADTGNDQIAAYLKDGTQKWRVGVRGPKQPGSFDNPRDLAYLNGRLYVADTGFNRVQVLDARTGAVLDVWPHRFGSVIGIGAGPDGHGGSVILTVEDDRNAITEWTPSGTMIRDIVFALGRGVGQLNAPRDADTSAAGYIYVADYANDRMVKLGPKGGWKRTWGVKGSAPGQFARPYGVAVDAANNVYVADSNNERIQEFTNRGVFKHAFGSPGDGPGQFTQLRRVAVGGGLAPRVYGADLWGNHISSFDQDGTVVHRWGTDHPLPGGFNEPSGMAVDSETFVADTVNQRIERFDTSTGNFELLWGARGWEKSDLTGFNWPRDVTINQVTNTVWVADTKNNRITQFTRNGTPTGRVFGHMGSDDMSLHWPFGIASIGQDVVIADTFNNRVERLDASGLKVMWTAGGLHAPHDVTVAGGIVYVADTSGNRVVELDPATGKQVGSFGSLHNPQGIAVSASGTVWVADTASNRLVEYAADGTLLQKLGATGGATGTAHGQFNHPTHLEIYAGSLYVADEYNDRIEVFTLHD